MRSRRTKPKEKLATSDKIAIIALIINTILGIANLFKK